MRDEVDIAGRLQLYEFFDIIPLSTYISNIEINEELNSGTAKDSQMLYKIDNFYNFLFLERFIGKCADKIPNWICWTSFC